VTTPTNCPPQDATVKAVGAVVWWSVPNTFSVAKFTFTGAAVRAGVDKIPSLTVAGSLSRLVREHAKRESGGRTVATDQRHLARPVRVGGHATYALVKERVVGSEITADAHVTHEEIGSAGVDAAGTIIVKNMPFTADDVTGQQSVFGAVEARRYLLQAAKRACGVTLRSMGGCYFVPSSKVEQFRREAEIVEPHGASVFQIRVPDMKEEREQLASIVTDEYRKALDELKAAAADPGCGARKMTGLAAQARAIGDDLRAHATALRMEFGGLLDEVAQAEGSFAAREAVTA
jgi:hypothetical protein